MRNSPQSTEQILRDTRRKIYSGSVAGVYARRRVAMVWVTQILFYGAPWLLWNGRQALLLDLAHRRLDLFGLMLWPQDLLLLGFLLLLIAVCALLLFTVVAGRLFCGYACPQSVYTEIFLWIERWVEGDRLARIRLDSRPMDARKFLRKAAKHGLWIALALWTGFTFVGYFSPIRQLAQDASRLGIGDWQTFWIAFYALATYGNAGFLREQVCKSMCPYARMQPLLFDQDTPRVVYDSARGEPRGLGRELSAPAQGRGACADCSVCVQVCPTGIDIREGAQDLCIDCGACVDACDQVMRSLRQPQGLIGYADGGARPQSWGPRQTWARMRRPRVALGGAVLLLLLLAFAGVLLRSPPARGLQAAATVVAAPGQAS